MNSDPYCSRLSLEAGESLAGSADQVHVWLMLEYRGPWGPQVVSENALDASFRNWLDGFAGSLRQGEKKVRVQFIKQQRAGDLRLFTIEGNRTLARSAPDYAALAGAADRPVPDRLYFVCTHGQRDRCCSEFGMPVYRALRDRLGDRVWQTSHLGGHRFAPNVLVTPDAVLYGRVAAGAVDTFLAATESGAMAMDHARGRTCYEPAAQAAEILANEHATPLDVLPEGDSRWSVVFGHRTVRVAGTPQAGLASCGDQRQKAGMVFSLWQ
jgi:hypothetical protein